MLDNALFTPERLLHFVCSDIRIFSVFQKAWPLVVAQELGSRPARFVFQSFGPAFQIHEYGCDAGLHEKRHGILEILVKVGIENALIHEVQAGADIEQDPAEVVKPSGASTCGDALHGFFDCLSVVANRLFPAGLDLRNDRKSIIRGCSWKDRAIAACSSLKYPSLGIAIAAGFVQSAAAVAAGCAVAGRSIAPL